jgi:hypothetical protein
MGRQQHDQQHLCYAQHDTRHYLGCGKHFLRHFFCILASGKRYYRSLSAWLYQWSWSSVC